MKTLLRLGLATLAGLTLISSATAGAPVVRTVVRDLYGKARVAYVRVSDGRILYPRVVQQIALPGGRYKYRSAETTSFYPDSFGYGVYASVYGYHQGANAICGVPRRCFYPNGKGYPSGYRPQGTSGIDAILQSGSFRNYEIPGYGRSTGAFPYPVLPTKFPGLSSAR